MKTLIPQILLGLGILVSLPFRSMSAGLADSKIVGYVAGPGWTVSELCYSAHVPCGFEALENPTPIRSQVGHSSGTLAALLDATLTGRMNTYVWRERAGVIEILPKSVASGTVSSPLDQRVPAVDFDNVFMAAAVLSFCKRYRVADSEVPGAVVTTKISVHLHDATIREVLDEMVRKDGKSMWTIYQTGNKRVLLLESWRPNLGR